MAPDETPASTDSALIAAIEKKVGEVRIDSFDISLGEIINLAKEGELVVAPDYQRLFRWSEEQRSRLIESLIVGLPIPQLFTIQLESGALELIDGLQRISSLMHFVDHTLIKPDDVRADVAPTPLVLTGCDIVSDLNGTTFNDLPMSMRLDFRRLSIRTVVVKRSSHESLRYQMFKRLNSGGSDLSQQEIRNCTARMVGQAGKDFYGFLVDCAQTDAFKIATEAISDSTLKMKGDEELVLRFFALKNAIEEYGTSITDFLDEYMETIILGKTVFDFEHEKQTFNELFEWIATHFEETAFQKVKDGKPIGALAPAYFEAATIGLLRARQQNPALANKDSESLRLALAQVYGTEEFRKVFTGPGANSKPKLQSRIAAVEAKFSAP